VSEFACVPSRDENRQHRDQTDSRQFDDEHIERALGENHDSAFQMRQNAREAHLRVAVKKKRNKPYLLIKA
jgi:hypothetical protein